ncbi:hypothetical protein ABIB48_000640 [Arthrobacter sp. UYCu511]
MSSADPLTACRDMAMVKKGDPNSAIAPAALLLPMEWPPRKVACSMNQQLPDCPSGVIDASGSILNLFVLLQAGDCLKRLPSRPELPVLTQTPNTGMHDPGSQELAHSKTLAVGCMRRDRVSQLAFRATAMLHSSEFLFGSGAVVGARSSGNRLGIRLGLLESPDILGEGRSGLVSCEVGCEDW